MEQSRKLWMWFVGGKWPPLFGLTFLFLVFLERESQSSRCLMHCRSTVSNATTHEAVSVDSLPTLHIYMYCRCTVK